MASASEQSHIQEMGSSSPVSILAAAETKSPGEIFAVQENVDCAFCPLKV